MWDREFGGWYWQTAPDGSPLGGSTKHSHSGAYAVQAAALTFQATGEKAALDHAEEGLAWFDRHALDAEFGGFHGWLTRDGSLIRTATDIPAGAKREEPLGHDLGLKDVNVHGDWFEALLDLVANEGSRRAHELLEESADIYLNRAITPAGEVHYAFHPNWMPQPGPEWYGYGFEAVHRFLMAAAMLPQFPDFSDRARKVMVHTISAARRREGGFAYAGPAGAPAQLEGSPLRVPARVWWVQFEGLRALALYAAKEEAPGPFTRGLQAHWAFLKRTLLGEKFGGIYTRPEADFRPWIRSWIPRNEWAFRKGDNWKDASHETGCLLEGIAALEGREGWGPLPPVS
jgi:mannose/cellobiose epimerase-like protein (N-acyl-D-glucosamine 2-epimerase family)